MEATEGVTVTVCKTAVETTTKVAEPLMVPEDACIVAVPAESPEAKPVELTLAVTALAEVQVTTFVMFELTPPVKVPVAVNCC